MALLLVAHAPQSPALASASEASEPETGAAETGVREESSWGESGVVKGMALWFWPEGKRIYQLRGNGVEMTSVVAYAADSMTIAAKNDKLSQSVWGRSPDVGGSESFSGGGRHHIGAVDRESGRLFLAYKTPIPPASIGEVEPYAKVLLQGNSPCLALSVTESHPGCVGGILMFDGETLEQLGEVPLALSAADSVRAAPIIRDLVYAPADPGLGWGGRVLMVVEESVNGGVEGSSFTYYTRDANARRNSGNVAYVVAFDPESMRQEWAVRVEGCRNSREPRDWLKGAEGHPSTVFRVGGDSPALYVGCHGNPAQQGVVVRVPLDAEGFPAMTPVRAGDPMRDLDPDAEDKGVKELVSQAPRQEVFAGPDSVTVMLADPASRRILMRVDDAGEVWWVFDGLVNQFIGTIGIGGYNHGHTTYGLDPDTGRMYVLAAKPAEPHVSAPGGLYVADIRRNPLAQALVYRDFADPPRLGRGLKQADGTTVGRAMSVEPRANRNENRIFSTINRKNGDAFRVLVDGSAVSVDTPAVDGVVRTLDVVESPGVTEATFDGTARGFGFRAILLGGVEGLARWGPADPVGVARGVPQLDSTSETGTGDVQVNKLVDTVVAVVPPPDGCSDVQREVVVAFVGPSGPAVVDASSARGEAQPVLADVRTREDVGAPVSRCGGQEWEALWQKALFGRAPVSEPGVEWPFEDARSSCTATEEESGDSWADPVVGAFSSRVDCGADEVGGWGQARGVGVDGVSVASALSSFRIYRDPSRGMVARVDSIARGVDIGGVVKIDAVRGAAESWANGHAQPVSDEAVDARVFNPWNCDRDRPAGTCFQRHVFGVRTPGYSCGPCGNEDALIEGLNRGLGAYGNARFREPNRELARGSADGYVAAITKKDKERFSDIVLNADLLETMVPMLEVVRFAPHNRPADPDGAAKYTMGTPPRGRQVYQFAAVEVSSTYGIQCLLVYDEAAGTCTPDRVVPGSIAVSLVDAAASPLAGGGFEVRQDVDADGVLGLKDTLIGDGACVTADDGVGTCRFDAVPPGPYLVAQTAAPAGYSKLDEPYVVELASGEARTVTFTNSSNVSTIAVSATDEAGAPVAGAVFAVFADRDSDGKVAPDAAPAATCRTDASGACEMKVPAGSWVLVQTAAPSGLEGIEPVAFTFASGGQVAAVSVVNYPPDVPEAPEASASPEIVYTPPVNVAAPVESVDDGYIPSDGVDAPRTAGAAVSEQIGGTIVRVIRAPGDALRLLARDPQQAVAWTSALALLCLAALAVRRRQLLGELTAIPAFAFTGGGTPPAAPPRPAVSPRGPAGPARPAGSSHGRHVVAGAAPAPVERAHPTVVALTASPVVGALVSQRLASAEQVSLLSVVDSLEQLRATLSRVQPDVLVADLELPGHDDVCAVVAGLHRPDRIVALISSRVPFGETVRRCARAGVGGVLSVDGDIGNGHLAYAIRQVAAGNPCYGPTVQKALFDRREANAIAGTPLSAREREIALLVANGMRRTQIAERLFLSDGTIKWYLRSIRSKLGVANPWDRDELVDRLRHSGLLDQTDTQP